MKRIVCTIFCAIMLVSCDCVQETYGIVVDKDTLIPLDSVFYRKAGRVDRSSTSSDGFFWLDHISGGIFGCPDMKVEFKKAGYEDLAIELNLKSWHPDDSTIKFTSQDTIAMKKIVQ